MLKQEQEDLLKEQRKLEQAVSVLFYKSKLFPLGSNWYGSVTLQSNTYR